MGISTPAVADDVSHWRVPGDDDQGQEARRALYSHSLAGSDDDEGDGDGDELVLSLNGADHLTARTEANPDAVIAAAAAAAAPLKWDVDVDARDRVREARHDQAFFAAHHQHVVHVKDQQPGAAAGAGAGAGAPTGTQAGVLVPLEVDRRVVRELMKEKLGADVVRIRFISSGTFHKAYLITLASSPPPPPLAYTQVVLRVARRFLPKLKTESEVATLRYLRAHTSVPVPEVYWYDANPYNRLGGEYIVMEKAKGIPLRKVYHSLPHTTLTQLLADLARLVIDVFGHRFSQVGSLYCGEDKSSRNAATAKTTADKLPNGASRSAAAPVQLPPTPMVLVPVIPNAASKMKLSSHLMRMIQPLAPPPPAAAPSTTHSGSDDAPIRPALATALSAPTLPSTLFTSGSPQRTSSLQQNPPSSPEKKHEATDDGSNCKFHIGAIVSWPFFGSSRGSLSHTQPQEIDRGPWRSAEAYYSACVDRELRGVERENEGRVRVGRLRMDPDEVVVRKRRNRGKARRSSSSSSKGRTFDLPRPVAIAASAALRAGGSRLRNEWGFGNVPGARERGTPDGDGSFSPVRHPTIPVFSRSTNEASTSSTTTSDNEDDDDDSYSDTGSLDSDTSSSSAPSVASDEDAFYRDYRCHQRSTFLVAELQRRKESVVGEMQRWKGVMQELEGILDETVAKLVAGSEHSSVVADDDPSRDGTFGLDCHDLSLDNVFVDEKDPGRITCIIDWESTTTRPLWQCAHLPSLLLTSPFASKLFRRAVATLASGGSASSASISTLVQSTSSAGAVDPANEDEKTRQRCRSRRSFASLASQWLLLERVGAPLRYAHKAAEWDGWEEGLVGTILGEDEQEEEDEPAKSQGQFRGLGVGNGGIIRLMEPAAGSSTGASESEKKKKSEELLAVEMKRVCANLLHAGTSTAGHGRLGGGAHKEGRRKHSGRLDHVLSIAIGSSSSSAAAGTGSHGSSTAKARTHAIDSAQQTSSAELTPGGRSSSSISRALANLVLPNGVVAHGGHHQPSLAVAAAAAAAANGAQRRRKSHGGASCVDDVTDGAEREREKMLDMRGDVCGGRGGELGRRLEAWLVEGPGDENDDGVGAVDDAVDEANMPLESPVVVGI